LGKMADTVIKLYTSNAFLIHLNIVRRSKRPIKAINKDETATRSFVI